MDLNLNLPEWLSVEAWDGYLEMRQLKKKPLTKRAALMALRKLNELRLEGFDPGMVLDQSTFMCWMGLFPLKGQDDGERASRKTFDAIRRETSVDAIRRTVESYNQVGRDVHGTKPQGNKRIGDGGVH
jgi:hypothetical protein